MSYFRGKSTQLIGFKSKGAKMCVGERVGKRMVHD